MSNKPHIGQIMAECDCQHVACTMRGYCMAQRIEELKAENETLRKGLEIYQRERDRFKHAKPEITGAYFLAGGHGLKDDNELPQFVEICPAYGVGWVQIYEDTGRIISYEGS
jgi:hypothetical protein